MQKKPKISVVIPTYNRKQYLGGAIESVLNQRGNFELEIIVVDDGSTDGTDELIENKYKDAVRYVRTQNAGRPSIPRNIGIKIASGDFIAFLDSDDIWLQGKLGEELKYFSDPDIGLVYSNAEFIDENGERLGRMVLHKGQGKSGYCLPHLLKDNFISTLTVMVRKQVLEKVGNFNESKKLRAIEDYELWLRAASNYKINYIDKNLALYRTHEGSISKTDNQTNLLLLLNAYLERLKDSRNKQLIRRRVIEILSVLGDYGKKYKVQSLFHRALLKVGL